MPAEPDNKKIEELVKAYAQKRREQAGQSFEIHPATRKMLQGEITRQKPPATERGTSPLASLLRFWPRLVFGSAVVAVLSMVLWNVSQHPNPSEERLKFAKTSDDDLKRTRDAESKAIDERLSRSEKLAGAKPALRNPAPAPVRKRGEEAEVRLQSSLDQAKKQELDLRAESEGLAMGRAKKPATQPPASLASDLQQRADLKTTPVPRESKLSDGLELAQQTQGVPANERRLSLARREDSGVKKDSDGDGTALRGFGNAPAGATLNAPLPAPQLRSAARYSEITENRGDARNQTGLTVAQAPAPAKPSLSVTERPSPPPVSFALSGAAADFGRGAGVSPSAPRQLSEGELAFKNRPSTANGLLGEPSPVTDSARTALAYDQAKAANPSDLSSSKYYARPNGSPVPAAVTAAPIAPSEIDSISGGLGLKPVELTTRYANFGDQYFAFATSSGVARSRFTNVIRQNGRDIALEELSAVDKKSKNLNDGMTIGQPLASTFDFEQNGDRVRIVDADGSIYEGTVSPTTAEKSKEAIPNPEPNKALDQYGFMLGKLSRAAFTASGTNRSSRKLVVVNGAVLADLRESGSAGAAPTADKTGGIIQPGAQRGSVAAFGTELSKAAAQPDQGSAIAGAKTATELVRAGRIQGTVQIDKTNLLRFDAVRQSP